MLTFGDRKSLGCNGGKGCKVSMLTFRDRKWPGFSDCKVTMLTFRDRKSPGCRD